MYEAMELQGMEGYYDDGLISRYYRQAPLNSLWEGTGNELCLEVVRSIREDPEGIKQLMREMETCFGSDSRFDGWFTVIRAEIALAESPPSLTSPYHMRARRLCDLLAMGFQASLLVRFGHPTIAEAFMASK